jgi:hypothetical protein
MKIKIKKYAIYYSQKQQSIDVFAEKARVVLTTDTVLWYVGEGFDCTIRYLWDLSRFNKWKIDN